MEKKIDKNYVRYSTSDCDNAELVIDDVYVCPEDRGRGLGKELINFVLDYAREKEYESVGLYAEPQSDDGLDGDALIEFYRSLGFESDSDCNQLMSYKL